MDFTYPSFAYSQRNMHGARHMGGRVVVGVVDVDLNSP